MRKFKWAVFLGLGLLAACSSVPKNTAPTKTLDDFAKYEKEYVSEKGNILVQGFDANKDGNEDLRLFYLITGSIGNVYWLELKGIKSDANKNGQDDEDFIWLEESGKPCPKEYEVYMQEVITTSSGSMIQDYDANRDGITDLRFSYSFVKPVEMRGLFQLESVMEDANGDHFYDKDETVWDREKRTQRQAINAPTL